jgi:phenylpropionate dioxygenase-like ring-hydroxylating dioxygenase large terminal subunit
MQFSPSTTQPVDVRTCGINPNHWYVVARSSELKDQPLSITLWKEAIVLYRDGTGQVRAVEDLCPHRQVKLSQGRVVDHDIECAYHGWRFNAEGNCVAIPYLSTSQKLPACKIRPYPVREMDGFIWLFPGKENQDLVAPLPLGIPEWEHLNYIATVATIECQAHYSFLIENLMDMYHGHLHEDYQAWTSASLKDLQADKRRVDAHYEAQSYYRIDKIWSISALFFPFLRRLHPEPLNVSYVYPHWLSTLGKDFKIYCLFCPIHETHTRAYLIHFTSLNAFWRLHKLPIAFRRLVKESLFGCAQKMLDGLVRQDVVMIEQEQQAYLNHCQRHSYELNPAVTAVQRLIRQQAEISS